MTPYRYILYRYILYIYKGYFFCISPNNRLCKLTKALLLLNIDLITTEFYSAILLTNKAKKKVVRTTFFLALTINYLISTLFC